MNHVSENQIKQGHHLNFGKNFDYLNLVMSTLSFVGSFWDWFRQSEPFTFYNLLTRIFIKKKSRYLDIGNYMFKTYLDGPFERIQTHLESFNKNVSHETILFH